MLALAMGLVGRGGDPPSCQESLEHYYSAGCVYDDISSGSAVPISETAIITECEDNSASQPPGCDDAFNAWLVCNDSVPDKSTTNADCDCSQEFMALLDCQ